MMSLYKINKKKQTANYKNINRIRFRSLTVDTDIVYSKLKKRIEMSKLKIGVSPVWKYVSVAACLALLCVSSFLIRDNFSQSSFSYLEVTALSGSKTHVLLPDSTEVWLNGDSWIRYPESFGEDRRDVILIGEAFFKVAKDEKCPFYVNLDSMSIQVLGTEFNVLAQKQSDIIETTLLEGSVALFKSDNLTNVPNHILIPGEQAVYSKKNGEIAISPVQSSFYSSWVTGDYQFEKVTFGQIIKVLERSFNVKFHLKDKALNDIYMTAQFTHHESLNDILSILQIPMKYKYTIKNMDVFIE